MHLCGSLIAPPGLTACRKEPCPPDTTALHLICGPPRCTLCCTLCCPPSAVLLECEEQDGLREIMRRLCAELARRALLAADVNSIDDEAELRRMLRQAQAALAGAP